MALLYAAVFFLAGIFPALFSKADRAILFSAVEQWLPATISIAVALFVAAVFANPRLSPRAAAAIAIVFAIVLACLAKDPSDRPQTARELARRLEAVPVWGEWTPELARAWWETNQPVPSMALAAEPSS